MSACYCDYEMPSVCREDALETLSYYAHEVPGLWTHIGGPLTRSYFRSEESAASAGADISSATIHPFKHSRSGGRHALT